MTRPFHSRRRRQTALDSDRDITEVLQRADWDGRTIPFEGASGTGLPDEPAALERIREAGHRAWDIHHGQQPAQDTAPLDRVRGRGSEPATFPALRDGQRDTGPMQRMPRLHRLAARPRPARPYDAALFAWSGAIAQHVMICGICLRSRYADPIAGHMPFPFESLRQSAHIMGWRLDRYARWACPACQDTAAYHAPYQVTVYQPDGARYGQAEQDALDRVNGSAQRGKHRAVTR